MKKLAAVLVLLAVVGVGLANEQDIIKGIRDAGGGVKKYDRGGMGATMPESAADADLTDLCELRDLTALSLRGVRITDRGLQTVSNMRELNWLGLTEMAITDKGLHHLESLSNLRTLFLAKCPNVTDEGVARLQRALPNCKIERP
jgi:hypothetical protein